MLSLKMSFWGTMQFLGDKSLYTPLEYAQTHIYKSQTSFQRHILPSRSWGEINRTPPSVYYYYYIRLTAFFPGQPGQAGTRKVNHSRFYWSKRRWGGSGISWTICKSFAPCSRQITMPVPHHSGFTGRMPFLPPNQQRQSTGGISTSCVNCV